MRWFSWHFHNDFYRTSFLFENHQDVCFSCSSSAHLRQNWSWFTVGSVTEAAVQQLSHTCLAGKILAGKMPLNWHSYFASGMTRDPWCSPEANYSWTLPSIKQHQLPLQISGCLHASLQHCNTATCLPAADKPVVENVYFFLNLTYKDKVNDEEIVVFSSHTGDWQTNTGQLKTWQCHYNLPRTDGFPYSPFSVNSRGCCMWKILGEHQFWNTQTSKHAMLKVTEITFTCFDVWYKHQQKLLTSSCMILCIVMHMIG